MSKLEIVLQEIHAQSDPEESLTSDEIDAIEDAGGLFDVGSLCDFCQYRMETLPTEAKCSVYPDGIPNNIFMWWHDHRLPYPGDGGIQFRPASDKVNNFYPWVEALDNVVGDSYFGPRANYLDRDEQGYPKKVSRGDARLGGTPEMTVISDFSEATFTSLEEAMKFMVSRTKAFVRELTGNECNVGFESMKNDGLAYANKGNRMIVYNLDFLKTNLANPYYFHRVIVHESLHHVNASHNEGFKQLLARYGPREPGRINSPYGATYLLECPQCGVRKHHFGARVPKTNIFDCGCGYTGITWKKL